MTCEYYLCNFAFRKFTHLDIRLIAGTPNTKYPEPQYLHVSSINEFLRSTRMVIEMVVAVK